MLIGGASDLFYNTSRNSETVQLLYSIVVVSRTGGLSAFPFGENACFIT